MKKSAPPDGATRITPSAPIPNRRSHSRRASSPLSSNRPARSSNRTKSLPVPWYFQNRSSSIRDPPDPPRQRRHDILDERLGPGLPRLEPADPRVPPEEAELPARERPGAPHRARDRRVERELAGEVTGQLSVPDGLGRGEPGGEPSFDETADLVEPLTLEHLRDAGLDPGSEYLGRRPDARRPNPIGFVRFPAPGEAGERSAGKLGDLERPHGAPNVPRLDLRGRRRVGCGEALVQSGHPDHRGLGLQSAARVRIGPREPELVHHRTLVERRTPHEQHPSPPRTDLRDRRHGQLLVARDAERLGGLGHVEEVVRDPSLLLRGRLGRPDVHPPIHEHRVDRDDLGAEAFGHRDPGLRLAPGGRTDQREQRRFGAGTVARGHHRTGAGSRGSGGLTLARLRSLLEPPGPPAASSPSRWCGWAPTIRTSRNVPGACSPPTCTTRLPRVRPRAPPLRPSPSIKTSADEPTCSRIRSSAIASWSATSRSKRSWIAGLSSCSSISAARVPGRGEYWNVYAWSKRARRTTSSVSSKSSWVSPGNPMMMSVLTAMSGIAARIRSSQSRYRSRRYERRIALSTGSEPDCSGKWMCSHTLSLSAIASITSGVKSWGCGLVNRIRRSPSTRFTARSRSANSGRRADPGTVRSRP